jgi:hypothetical protein
MFGCIKLALFSRLAGLKVGGFRISDLPVQQPGRGGDLQIFFSPKLSSSTESKPTIWKCRISNSGLIQQSGGPQAMIEVLQSPERRGKKLGANSTTPNPHLL